MTTGAEAAAGDPGWRFDNAYARLPPLLFAREVPAPGDQLKRAVFTHHRQENRADLGGILPALDVADDDGIEGEHRFDLARAPLRADDHAFGLAGLDPRLPQPTEAGVIRSARMLANGTTLTVGSDERGSFVAVPVSAPDDDASVIQVVTRAE